MGWPCLGHEQSWARHNEKEAAMRDEKYLMALLAKWKRTARAGYGLASRKEG